VIDGGDWGRMGRIDGYECARHYLQDGNSTILPAGSSIDWMIMTHPHSNHCGGGAGLHQDGDIVPRLRSLASNGARSFDMCIETSADFSAETIDRVPPKLDRIATDQGDRYHESLAHSDKPDAR